MICLMNNTDTADSVVARQDKQANNNLSFRFRAEARGRRILINTYSGLDCTKITFIGELKVVDFKIYIFYE